MIATGPSRYLFTAFGTPVRAEVGAVFLVVLVLASYNGHGPTGMLVALVVLVVALVSLLAHEFGHALAVRALGLGRSEIVLGAMGGYCRWNGPVRPWQRLIVALAGPAVSLALAGVGFAANEMVPREYLTNQWVMAPLGFLAMANLYWAIFNLLPIMPLDGGTALRSALSMAVSPRNALRASNLLSVATAAVCVVFALRHNLFVAALLLGYLGWQSLTELRRVPAGT